MIATLIVAGACAIAEGLLLIGLIGALIDQDLTRREKEEVVLAGVLWSFALLALLSIVGYQTGTWS